MIPYTVSEARNAAQTHKMDVYHRELILWLCGEVDRLSNPHQSVADGKTNKSKEYPFGSDLWDVGCEISAKQVPEPTVNRAKGRRIMWPWNNKQGKRAEEDERKKRYEIEARIDHVESLVDALDYKLSDLPNLRSTIQALMAKLGYRYQRREAHWELVEIESAQPIAGTELDSDVDQV